MANVEVSAGVGWTALLTAYGRAQESREQNALFDDPVARVYLSRADADDFLDRITQLSALGSRLADEYVSRRFLDSDVRPEQIRTPRV